MLNHIRYKLSEFTINDKRKGKPHFIVWLLIMSLTSCNLIFTPDEVGLAQLKTEDDYENAINGVYGLLTASLDDGADFSVNIKGDDLSYQQARYYNYVPSDPIYEENVFDSISNICVPRQQYNPVNSTINHEWVDLYKAIISSNNLINQYSENITIEKIRDIVGEAFLIRAYCYFRLTRTYGQIPITEDIEVDYTLPKSSFVEIYEFIEYNLLMAEELLPKNNSVARIPMVTPHKGTALAIMAELYLSWAGYPVKDYSKYDIAASTAEMVVDSANIYGMGLMDDFADLWKKENLYNKESVFSVYYPFLTEEDNKYHVRYMFQVSFDNRIPYNIILQYFATEYQFYNNYPKNYRRDITFFNTVKYFEPKMKENGEYYLDTVDLYLDKVEPCREISYRKFFYDLTYDDNNQENNRRQECWGSQRLDIFRFAHTLLTYAEAAARSGRLDTEAYECVNMIRRRANHLDIHTPSPFDLQPGLSPEVFADSVVWERAWELAGEPEGRWFDLVRLEMVEDLPELKGINDGDFPVNGIVSKDDYYFPIPEEEIVLNPNLSE